MFKFKKFELIDDQSPMKIGMDSVLLGSWVDASIAKTALDIGSGCGILSFMLAQRFPDLKIQGIEIFNPSYQDSLYNLQNFSLLSEIIFINDDFKTNLFDTKFDLIISNPPFFSEAILPKDEGRLKARFDRYLSLEQMIDRVSQLLNCNGKFVLVYDFKRFSALNTLCLSKKLFLVKKVLVHHKPKSTVKRVLLEYSNSFAPLVEEVLYYKESSNEYSDNYKILTQEFYLSF
jgi:tRNA1Val (adenine37-N6)-methyltransferase